MQGGASDMQMLPPWLKLVSALALIALVALPRFIPGQSSCQVEEGEKELELEVSGMTCQHCAESARKATMACSGVSQAHVDLRTGRVRVCGTAPSEDEIRCALAGAGFTAKQSKRG